MLPLLFYICVATLYYGPHIFPIISDHYIGMSADPAAAIWALNWWSYAFTHSLSLFHSPHLWNPIGVNLTKTQGMPLLGILFYPLIKNNPIAAYNIIVIYASALSAFTAFVLCKQLTKSTTSALLGGYLFGFSSYQLAQSLAHLCLAVTFLIPLIVLICVRYYKGSIKEWLFVLLCTLLTTLQFYLNPEFVVTTGLLILFIVLFGMYAYPDQRKKIKRFFMLFLLSNLLVLPFISVYLYDFIVNPSSEYLKNTVWNSIPLFNLFIPTPIHWLGGDFFSRISDHFPANIFETGGYLGLPLLTIITLYLIQNRKSPKGKLLAFITLLLLLLSLGPHFHLIKDTHIPLPWRITKHIPILQAILPARFSLFTSLAAAVITSIWLKESNIKQLYKWPLAITAVIFLFPAPTSEKFSWASNIDIPAYFIRGDFKQDIPDGANVLTLPFKGDESCFSMLWQMKSNMQFKLANGCSSGDPDAVTTLPIYKKLSHLPLADISEAEFKSYLFTFHVYAIIVKENALQTWQPLLEKIHIKPIHKNGVYVYRVA